MCGRYASTSTRGDLLAAYDAVEAVGEELPPSYNIAPTQRVNVVLERAPREDPDAEPIRIVSSQIKWGSCRSGRRTRRSGRG